MVCTVMKREKKSHWGAREKRRAGRFDSARNKAIADHRHAADQIKREHETKYLRIHLQLPKEILIDSVFNNQFTLKKKYYV